PATSATGATPTATSTPAATRAAAARSRSASTGWSSSGPVREYCTAFACASTPVPASSLGHVAGPHLPHCVLATDDDPRATPAQHPRTDPLARRRACAI